MIIRYSYKTDNFNAEFKTLANEVIIGRGGGSDRLDLDDIKVSRKHARITYENDAFYIEDLGSANKTWVNEKSITSRTLLTPEDIIKIGDTKLRLEPQSIPSFDRSDPVTHVRKVQGKITASIDTPQSPDELLETVDDSRIVRRYLAAFYELESAVIAIHSLDALLTRIVEHICQTIPGVEVGGLLLEENGTLVLKAHFPAVSEFKFSRSRVLEALDTRQSFIWRYMVNDLTSSLQQQGTREAMYAPLLWKGERVGVLYVANNTYDEVFSEEDLRLFTAIANQSAMVTKNYILQQTLHREETILSNLLRQFSPKVAERLLHNYTSLELDSNYASPVTILVSDVRGFTAMSARMTPERVVDLLNRMFTMLIPIVFKYDGTIDKFVGDAILAVFGSPEPDDRQWEKAVSAALEMQAAMEPLIEECQIGIALHTGGIMHGFIGTAERMEYTIIGDTVNRASRYCDAAGRGEVVISKEMYEKVAAFVEVDAMPKILPTKHPESEPDMEVYVVKALKEQEQ